MCMYNVYVYAYVFCIYIIREAAKKVPLLVVRPLTGGGGRPDLQNKGGLEPGFHKHVYAYVFCIDILKEAAFKKNYFPASLIHQLYFVVNLCIDLSLSIFLCKRT